ncbi:hypothetical protein GW17_00029873 [Ensete ventricosum]|nr:hypothetical protein GW17_00029873 [Ensete ventricosum]
MLTGRWREEEVDLAGSMRDREQVHQAERKVTDIKVDRCAAREGERRKQRPWWPSRDEEGKDNNVGIGVRWDPRNTPPVTLWGGSDARAADDEEKGVAINRRKKGSGFCCLSTRYFKVSPFGCSGVVGGRESPMASSSNAKHKRIAEEEEDEEETLEEV